MMLSCASMTSNGWMFGAARIKSLGRTGLDVAQH
jgi:hypothetical protein